MKKLYTNIFYSITAILGFASTPALSQTTQNAKPVTMRYVGNQQYIGQQQQIIPQQRQVAPTINSVYATPMHRVNEIPLYGKNKSMYFYNQPKNEDGKFSGIGLYLFGSFSTGKTTKGVNAEDYNSNFSYSIGSDGNKDMGDATGLTFGFGRSMSSNLNIELMYSKYSGMKYGNAIKNKMLTDGTDDFYPSEANEKCYDEEGNYLCYDKTTDSYKITSGGDINSDFFGIGFQYKLDGLTGGLFGMLKPYIGVQVGFAMNTLDDFNVFDPDGYSEGDEMYTYDDDGNTIVNDELKDVCTEASKCTTENYTDGDITFIGETNKTFGYGLELGFTIALENNMEIDVFFKRNMFGKVKTSGNALASYYETDTYFYSNDNGTCSNGFTEDSTSEWCFAEADIGTKDSKATNAVESGDLYMNQLGIKLKYMF